jgi:hypothetical protein
MRVFIANFGQANYLWPECLKRGTVATIDNVSAHPFLDDQDRAGFVDHAVTRMKTAWNETPTRAVWSLPYRSPNGCLPCSRSHRSIASPKIACSVVSRSIAMTFSIRCSSGLK